MKKFCAILFSFVLVLMLALPVAAEDAAGESDSLFDTAPALTAPAGYVVNLDTNIVVYEKNSETQLSAASLTKMMTTLLLLENYQDQLDSISLTAPSYIYDLICPTGKILPVDGTPMDFRTGKPLGRDLDTGFYQTTMAGGGFDHCYVLDRPRGASQSLCAWASSDKTGISMKMYTTQPGIQLYTGNFLQNCPSPGKGGVPLEKYGGFALETQHFPCSPSHPEFPTTVLRAGKVFRANTTLRFFTGRQCGRL